MLAHELNPQPTKRPSQPFLRWAGGKQWLSKALAPLVREISGRYFEPFLGGGALFFESCPARATLGDTNASLVATYQAIRDQPELVTRYLREWDLDEATYYAVRQSRFRSSARLAARFIYLNRTCWNGLYRVNRRGEFNVPFGRPLRNDPLDIQSILTASRVLQHAQLQAASFDATLESAGPGDLVYCDPPYTIQHENNGFIKYNEILFSWQHQKELAALAADLRRNECTVIVSNAWHDSLVAAYDEFYAYRLTRLSTLGGTGSTRGSFAEGLFASVPIASLSAYLTKTPLSQ